MNKYQAIDIKTIEYLREQLSKRYPQKQLEEALKKQLHQIWGAYYSTRPNFTKILKKNKEGLVNPETTEQTLTNILRIHSSTAERLPLEDANNFFHEILMKTGCVGKPITIVDHGCGLNPLFFTSMGLPKGSKYFAYDIDIEEIEFLKEVVNLIKSPVEFHFTVGNILFYEPTSQEENSADIAFLLKLLPVIEQQAHGKTLEVLQKQTAKYLIISFPLKTLSGREVGMGDSYSRDFENLVSSQGWTIQRLEFPKELVYIVKK